MLFGETMAVYCENSVKHTNTLCGQNAEFQYVKAGGTYNNHCAFKGLKRSDPLKNTKKCFICNLYMFVRVCVSLVSTGCGILFSFGI
jgi:hypothetical protein